MSLSHWDIDPLDHDSEQPGVHKFGYPTPREQEVHELRPINKKTGILTQVPWCA